MQSQIVSRIRKAYYFSFTKNSPLTRSSSFFSRRSIYSSSIVQQDQNGKEFKKLLEEYTDLSKVVTRQANPEKYSSLIQQIKNRLDLSNIWEENPQEANRLSKELGRLQSTVANLEKIQQEVNNIIELYSVANEELKSSLSYPMNEEKGEEDKSLLMVLDECESKMKDLVHELKKIKFRLLFTNHEQDCKSCYMEIVAGSGGTDSQNWAFMLFQMYNKWIESNQNKKASSHLNSNRLEIMNIDVHKGELADTIRSALLKVEGEYAYGMLQSESGVHRLVRISPYDSQSRRHTSFAMVRVFPIMEQEETKINEIPSSDLKIETMKSQGPGGQHVNKTNSAVRITHLPTLISVSSQSQRSQNQNMKEALSILKAKLLQVQQIANENQKREFLAGLGSNENGWGKQIRSYVLHPYILCKDHRTNFEVKNNEVQDLLNRGESLTSFIETFLEMKSLSSKKK